VKLRDFVATDGIVKAYAAYIQAPKAPAVEAYLDQLRSWHLSSREFCFIVTNNGKVWSYALRPYHVLQTDEYGNRILNYIPTGGYVSSELHKVTGVRSRSRLESGYREPVAWALRDLARRSKLPVGHPDALQLSVAYEREAPADAFTKLTGPCGPITYTGFSAKVGAYTLDQIHQTVCDAINAHLPLWAWRTSPPTPWKPSNLEVMLHSGNRAMGLAFAPGTGHTTNKRTISLNDILFKRYDLKSAWRVVIHELCHHYRDEALPSNEVDAVASEQIRQAVASHLDVVRREHGAVIAHKTHLQAQQAFSTHDPAFVRELSKVDERVAANAFSGMLFTEYADPSLVAQIREKKAQKIAKIDWHPSRGRVFIKQLKSGKASVYWLQMAGGAPVKVGNLNSVTMKLLINRLYEAAKAASDTVQNGDAARMALEALVTYDERWNHDPNWRQPTVRGFCEFLEKRFSLKIFGG
jgi:hypothetical protein